jgi:hypothetical protein
MLIERSASEIIDWIVCFYPDSPVWYGRLVPGQFKHVAIFAYVKGVDAWIFQEVIFSHARTVVIPNNKKGLDVLDDLVYGADKLRVVREAGAPVIFRGPLTCVSFAKHMVGAKSASALRPDGLYRALIKQGAQVVEGDGLRRQRRRERQ